jgi:hypothetical protein
MDNPSGSIAILKSAIQALMEHEQAISNLYETFAAAYPSSSRLWNRLAEEEFEHAMMLARLAQNMEQGDATFVLGTIRMDALHRSIDSVRHQTERFQGETPSIGVAFGTALAIENDLVEREFYEVAGGDSDDVKELKEAMISSIRIHVTELQKSWKEQTIEGGDEPINASQPGPKPEEPDSPALPAADGTLRVEVHSPPEASSPAMAEEDLESSHTEAEMSGTDRQAIRDVYTNLQTRIASHEEAVAQHEAEIDSLREVRLKMRGVLRGLGVTPPDTE